MVKKLPSKAEDAGLDPGRETKVPHFVRPLSLCEKYIIFKNAIASSCTVRSCP